MPTPVGDYTAGKLAVHVYRSETDAGRAAAQRLAQTVRDAVCARGHARIVLATGNSQLAFVAALADQPAVPWRDVSAFHLDEYVGLSADHPASFRRWVTTNVVRPLGIGEAHLIDGTAADETAESRRYEALLRTAPLDAVCLGIGENGHLAFNEPGTDLDDPAWVRVVTLDERSRRQQVDEGHFAAIADVPARAYSLTIPALLAGRTVQVVAPERRKAQAVRAALTAPISPACPATVLREAAHATLFLDRDSASLLDRPASAD